MRTILQKMFLLCLRLNCTKRKLFTIKRSKTTYNRYDEKSKRKRQELFHISRRKKAGKKIFLLVSYLFLVSC